MKKSSKRILIISSIAAVLIASGVFVFLNLKGNNETDIPVLRGGNVPELVTRIKVITGTDDPTAYAEELYYPLGIVLADKALVIADNMNDRVQIMGESEIICVGKPGSSEISYSESGEFIDGYLQNARFKKPSDLALQNGDIVVCDTGNNAVRKISGNVVISVAGGNGAGYQNGKEGEAKFNSPQSVAVSEDGIIYVADTMNHCIRTIDADGNVSLFAGTPEQYGFTDGDLLSAQFYEPFGLCFGENGELYVADSANHSIRKIENGTVSTVAGMPGGNNSVTGYPDGGLVDGSNADARFNFPHDLAVLPSGDIYVADTANHCIRLITDGVTRTVLGNGQAEKFYGSPENMRMSKPSGIATDGKDLYISDSVNNCVLVVPITKELKNGRPLRDDMLKATGADTSVNHDGDIRVFVNGKSVDTGKVSAWNTADGIYVPVKPLFEALGGTVSSDKNSLTVEINGKKTTLERDENYFMNKGAEIITEEEFIRLFPFVFEWFPQYGIIAVSDGN